MVFLFKVFPPPEGDYFPYESDHKTIGNNMTFRVIHIRTVYTSQVPNPYNKIPIGKSAVR